MADLPGARAGLAATTPYIEGPPTFRSVAGLALWFWGPAAVLPPRWKVAVVTRVGVFPTVYLLFWLTMGLDRILGPAAASGGLTVAVVALMTWVMAPAPTKLFKPWLSPRSSPRNRALPLPRIRLQWNDLTSMGVFVKAVEHGSFRAASDALQMSAQFVGKHVHSLEQHLGVRLLHRTTRQQSLTDFGRAYYERGKVILAEVEAAEEMAEIRAVRSGRLRIGAPVSSGCTPWRQACRSTSRPHPKVDVELTLSNRVVDVVEEGCGAVFRNGVLAVFARTTGRHYCTPR